MNIVEVEARSRLIKYKERRFAALQAEEVGQLDALILAAAESAAALAQLNVAQTNVAERQELRNNALLPTFCEKVDGLIDRHLKYVVDIPTTIFHL